MWGALSLHFSHAGRPVTSTNDKGRVRACVLGTGGGHLVVLAPWAPGLGYVRGGERGHLLAILQDSYLGCGACYT